MKARPFLAVVLAAVLLLLSLAAAGWWLVLQRSPLQLQHQPLVSPRAARFVPRQAPLSLYLLTDGQRTTGPDVMESAKMAADRGVRVYTVGVGTKEGEVIGFEGWSMRVRLDEESLQKVAAVTQGEYFYAGTAADLKKVYQSLSSRLVVETKETEISFLLAAAGAFLMLLGTGLSVTWLVESKVLKCQLS